MNIRAKMRDGLKKGFKERHGQAYSGRHDRIPEPCRKGGGVVGGSKVCCNESKEVIRASLGNPNSQKGPKKQGSEIKGDILQSEKDASSMLPIAKK